MVNLNDQPRFKVETMSESEGHCDCCGNLSKTVWGTVHDGEATLAAYWMHWTVRHLIEPGANLDLGLGQWGDSATAADRFGVSLIHRQQTNSSSSVMVIDAANRPMSKGNLASVFLSRDEVIGTPIAAQVFSVVDAIYEQDGRFF